LAQDRPRRRLPLKPMRCLALLLVSTLLHDCLAIALTVAEAERLSMSLWSGIDLASDTALAAATEETEAGQLARRGTFKGASKGKFQGGNQGGRAFRGKRRNLRHVQVLGLQDTGTNLLESLLKNNFRGKLNVTSKQVEGGIWKHANLAVSNFNAEARDQLNHLKEDKFVVVAMIRNPLSWFQSLHVAPYEWYDCMRKDAWLNEPCYQKVVFRKTNATGLKFRDIEAAWAMWTQAYDDMASYGLEEALVVRYEDLVTDVESQLRRIAKVAGVPMPETIQQTFASAKQWDKHHNDVGHAEAVAKLQARSYLKAYTTEQRKEVCKRLNLDILIRHGYGEDCME